MGGRGAHRRRSGRLQRQAQVDERRPDQGDLRASAAS